MAGIRRLGALLKWGNNIFLPQVTQKIENKSIISGLISKVDYYPQSRGYYTFLPWLPRKYEMKNPKIEEPVDEKNISDVVSVINDQIDRKTTSRLFAVVHICGKQFKVTENDIIIIQGYWPPVPGDKLRLEKVLVVGGTDFSLIGKPILGREFVNVDATVIDKTFSQTKIMFRYRKRKQYHRTHFNRTQYTMLRINSINIDGSIDKKKEIEGLDRIY